MVMIVKGLCVTIFDNSQTLKFNSDYTDARYVDFYLL